MIELEERTCAGGCGRKFKVTPNSKHATYFSDCETRCEKRRENNFEIKKKFNPNHGADPKKRDWRRYGEWQNLWSGWEGS